MTWTIIEEHFESRYGKKYSLAVCDCGVKKIIQLQTIKEKRSLMCMKCSQLTKKKKTSKHKNIDIKDGIKTYLCLSCREYLLQECFYNQKDNKYRDCLSRYCKLCEKKKPSREKECLKKYRRKYFSKKREDQNFRMISNFRSRLGKTLRVKKKDRTIEIIGCSINELKNYISPMFKPGMSWENYGRDTWHLDHIRPVSLFDLSDYEQVKMCFHYTNLQPLWAKENMSKGKKYNEEILTDVLPKASL